jgi:hypothetical protein
MLESELLSICICYAHMGVLRLPTDALSAIKKSNCMEEWLTHQTVNLRTVGNIGSYPIRDKLLFP